ncbi:MAG: cytochrome P450 [Actinobacteria bacterium]|nr:cytochrome P450 [Actinomycetota bacterium]
MRGIEDLPFMPELGEPDWGRDLSAFVDDIFSRDYQGLLKGVEGILIAYRNQDVRTLMADQTVGNIPLDFVTMTLNEKLGSRGEGWEHFMACNVITMTPPLHAPARQIITRQLARGKVAAFEDLVDQVVMDVAREMVGPSGTAELDLQSDFAARVTARFWGSLLGLDVEEQDLAREMADEMSLGLQIDYPAADAERADRGAAKFMDVLSAGIMRELDREPHPMVLQMQAELEDIDLPGRPATVGDLLAANLFDGMHTMKTGIANVVFGLLDNPAIKKEVDTDPQLIEKAVKEGLRLYAPVSFTGRVTFADVTLGDCVIGEGTPIMMLWSIANRDPNVFDQPNTFRLDRPTGPQATFGGGLQVCPGRHIATMVAESVVRLWCTGGIEIELEEAGPWLEATLAQQLISLRVTMSVPGD